MPRKPDVSPELLYEVLQELTETRGERPTSDEMALVLSGMLGRTENPIASATVRSAIHRWGKDWDLAPPARGAARAVLDYEAERALGPVTETHKRTWHWFALTAYERQKAGMAVHEKIGQEAESLVESLLEHGDVVDYDAQTPRGFYVRPGLLWELGGYLRGEVPTNGVAILSEALRAAQDVFTTDDGREVPITDEHRAYWSGWLEERSR